MKIEYEINTVTIRPTEIGENYPFLLPTLKSYLPSQKPYKKRITKKDNQSATYLLDQIIDCINK